LHHHPQTPRHPARAATGPATALALAGLVALGLAACGKSDGDGGGASPAKAAAWEGPLPADLTSAEVCALIDEERAGAILGVEIREVKESTMSTPQCDWLFKVPDGPVTNVVIAVQRAEGDLRGKAGRAALDHAIERYLAFQAGAEPTPIPDLGEAAVALSGGSIDSVMALAPDGRVVTVSGQHASAEARVELARAAVAGLSARAGD
jgi:hypothetical protein